MRVSERKYIHFEEIPSTQTCVKFKEFFYSTTDNKMIECLGDSYHRINIDRVDSILVREEDNLVFVLGMNGKFFI